MTRRLLLVPVEGDVRMVDAPNDFRALADLIGAKWVERVKVSPDWAMAIDEEGLLNGRPLNRRATLLYNYEYTRQTAGAPTSPIVGDVLLGIEGFVGDGVDWLDTVEETAKHFLSARGAL